MNTNFLDKLKQKNFKSNYDVFEYVNNYLGNKYKIDRSFKTYGIMIDLSRGAVFKVEYLKNIIYKSHLLGINEIWLYLEDTYKVDIPYFGYKRAGYSEEELIELDKFAYDHNIELVYSIQTLGHMGNFLRWNDTEKYKDNIDVLLADNEETYNLIDKMIKFCKKTFRSTKIHVGLDETFGLGFGKYYTKNGLNNPLEIFIRHANRVNEICKLNGYKDIYMWSDMLFQLSNGYTGYYNLDTKLDLEKIKKLKDFQLVFWDYYHNDYHTNDKMIKLHKEISNNIVLASGYWTWTNPYTNYYKTKDMIKTQIKVLRDNNLDKVIFTCWNDNGAYVNFDSVFLSILKSTEEILCDGKDLSNYYKFLFNEDIEKPLEKAKISLNNIMSMGIIYDDLLHGIYLNNFEKEELEKEIKFLESLKNINDKEYLAVKGILINKLKLRIKLVERYNNKESFLDLILDIDLLIKYYKKYLECFTNRWLKNYRPNGLEIHEIRIGGIIQRLRGIKSRIKNNDKLEELGEIPPKKDKYVSVEFEQVYSSSKIIVR